jgi:aminoglycoside phosphotransferase (APT) family kinase protein
VLHGDFTPDQVLLHGRKRLTFIDFDWMAKGDPALDLGSFCGALRQLASDGELSPELAAAAEAKVLKSYRKAGGARVPPGDLGWYRAVFLLKRSLEAVVRLDRGWRQRMERYRELAATEPAAWGEV